MSSSLPLSGCRGTSAAHATLRMAFYQKMILWSFFFHLAGAENVSVIYPFTRTCAVKGSSVTLPCTFTPLQFKTSNGGTKVPLRIVRVGWCKNHEICQEMRPPVYDSDSDRNNPRYRYLGDKKTNCTLQIRDVQREDDATFRFRMEADNAAGHFTNRTGVRVIVVDSVKMFLRSSRDDGQFRGGETASLQCYTVACSTHHLNLTWFRDDHALPETGSALQLGPLTAEDSGNYTCGLGAVVGTRSDPYVLQVEADPAEEANSGNLLLMVGVASGVLLLVSSLILVIFIIKRKRAADLRSVDEETERKPTDHIYSDILRLAVEDGGRRGLDASPEMEDVSYAPVQFRRTTTQRRDGEEAGDSVVYASVATRG